MKFILFYFYRQDSTKWDSCTYYDLDYGLLSSIKDFEAAKATVNYTSAVTKQCTKWSYDKSVYVSTTVTEVRFSANINIQEYFPPHLSFN